MESRVECQDEPGYRDIPLENLVTRSSLGSWDLDDLAERLEGHGVSTRTRYITPTLAVVMLAYTGGQARMVTQPQLMTGYIAFVELDADRGVWRIRKIGEPEEDVERMRLGDLGDLGRNN